ncbi:Hamartin [Armadillidium nasatum]|uniref:Hamartin n=1 Tax=Armadillidium nasatum TaxID=96803 RepID=A0A5N5TNE7_9CRUS|nr:Hamartin [Armadillidium nasatum]
MTKEESANLTSLSVEDFMTLLNSSPREEVVNEFRNIIKEHFKSVSDKWLVSGLLDYYFLTNSKRILDLLMGAPEPHWKYLLEKIYNGIKSCEKFRFLSILLYAVSRNPPPIWIHRIPNYLMKDLLDILSPTKESDINVLVSGVMVIVLLLPAMPYEFNKYLTKVLQCFWKLVHWTPKQEHDIALRPYLQVAVYSLFQRLYALYPCNLLGFLRANMVGQANKLWYLSTLRPMLERVRFHPLLVSETKDTEVIKNRWVGLEPNDLLHECAKICLDPLHEICEEIYLSKPSNRQSLCDSNNPEVSDFIVLCSSENNFWSPGAIQSPSTANTTAASIPHTPVYTYQILSSNSTGIAESPPEAAIEATPETTPFASPMPYAPPRDESKVGSFLKLKSTPVVDVSTSEYRSSTPLSPTTKDTMPMKFPQKPYQDILSRSGRSDILQSKLQEIQHQRLIRQREGESLSSLVESFTSSDGDACLLHSSSKVSNESKGNFDRAEIGDNESGKEGLRKRKLAVFDSKSSETSRKSDSDLFGENRTGKEELLEKSCETESSEVVEIEASRKRDSEDFESSNSEGLGLPSRHSMTELVKSVKTNRLRFLSQCGPPPNLALLSDASTRRTVPRSESLCFKLKRSKSRSYPESLDMIKYVISPITTKQGLAVYSSSNSPVKPHVETTEIATQTEEGPVVNPYEQILDLLSGFTRVYDKEKKEYKGNETFSPYKILDQYIEESCGGVLSPTQETGYVTSNRSLNDTAKNHLRAMQCIVTLERYKRETHAGRNRRLLGKIKRLHLLQEKDITSYKEKQSMKEEIGHLGQNMLKLQEKNNSLEKKVSDMVEKSSLLEVEEKLEQTIMQRDELKMKCEALQREKLTITKELEEAKSSSREFQRQLKIYSRNSAENGVLRNQVDELTKRTFLMGEIQMEMHQQLKNFKESQRHYRQQILANQKVAFTEKIEQLESQSDYKKTSLHAAMYRIKELTEKLRGQHDQTLNHRKEIDKIVAAWQEKCSTLDKRNKQLCSINSTLEGQITQLLKHRPERENESGAESRPLVSPSDAGGGFPLSVGSRETSIVPEVNPDSFTSSETSSEFKPIGSPTPYE